MIIEWRPLPWPGNPIWSSLILSWKQSEIAEVDNIKSIFD